MWISYRGFVASAGLTSGEVRGICSGGVEDGGEISAEIKGWEPAQRARGKRSRSPRTRWDVR
jgi:hypothetical protein